MTILRWTMKLLGLALLAGIFTVCLNKVPQQIQADLRSHAELLLKEKNLDWVIVSIDGRDITLSGMADDNLGAESALNIVASISGVRVINNKILTPESESQENAGNRGFRLSLAEPSQRFGAELNLPMVSQPTSIQYDIAGRN